MRFRLIGAVGWVVIGAFVATAVALADFLAGTLSETATIRQESRKFREQAAYLLTPTLNMVPSMRQEFRASASDGRPAGARVLRTDRDGYIETGNAVQEGSVVLFLGGSTTELNEVDEIFRFPSIVEKRFSKHGLHVRALNAGVRGHTTQDSLNSLINRSGAQDVAVVVLMENINDRLRLAVSGSYAAALGTVSPTSGLAVKEATNGLLDAVWDYLSYRSNLLFLTRTALSRYNAWTGEERGIEVIESNIDFPDPNFEHHRRLYERNLRLFVAAVNSLGAQPVLMTQPLRNQSHQHGLFNEIVRRVAFDTRSALIDLDRVLPRERGWAYLSDGIHFNNAGSRAVGNIVAEHLAPLLETEMPRLPIDDGVTNLPAFAARCTAAGDIASPGPAKQLVAEPARYPSISSDGLWLLFQAWKDGRERLHALDTRDGSIKSLTPETVTDNERHPTFLSYDSDRFDVVFGQGYVENDPASSERLMIRNWPTLSTRRLELGTAINGSIPTVAGRQIVFAGMPTGSNSAPDLFSISLDQGSLVKLTDTKWEEWRPAIAPDGTIYFIANPHGQFDIFRLRPGSSKPELYYSSAADEWDPAVSPNGRWIAFASNADGNWNIYVASTDDSTTTTVVARSADDEWDPHWHPNGNLLLYGQATSDGPRIMGVCVFGEQ